MRKYSARYDKLDGNKKKRDLSLACGYLYFVCSGIRVEVISIQSNTTDIIFQFLRQSQFCDASLTG